MPQPGSSEDRLIGPEPSLRVIRADLSLGGDPRRLVLGPDLGRDFGAARSEAGPVAFILRDEDIRRLEECRSLLVDRGVKHPSRSLASIMLGQERIPLVRGGYESRGRLLQGIRGLLAKATERNDGNLYLVGAGDELFQELWDRSPDDGPPRDSGPAPAAGERAAAAAAGSEGVRGLAELLKELPVSAKLVEAYRGDSAEVRLVRQLVVRAARVDDPVLILGDTGTGKEVVARLIHYGSVRERSPFIAVNCGAIPKELFESELFGFEKGAHSTAHAAKTGHWRSAHRGTLFLDEIADLALDHQVKILRALDSGEIWPVGSEKPVQVDARILAATNRDLFAMVQRRQFREDLYYRLRSFMIPTPPLKAHPGDIPDLAQALWRKVTHDEGAALPADIIAVLKTRGWPGNVRELRTFLSTLFGLFGGKDLGVAEVEAVLSFERQVTSCALPGDELEEVGTHRLHCLRHLRQVDEVMRAAQVPLREVMRGEGKTPERFRAIAEATADRVNELELLCAHPLQFHGNATFAVVRRLKERLREFGAQLQVEPEAALIYWRKELEPAFAEALAAVFGEVERVVGGG